jgi:hypothetical protein
VSRCQPPQYPKDLGFEVAHGDGGY